MNSAVTPEAAVQALLPGMKVFIHGAAATPTPLIEAMCRHQDLSDVTLYHLHTEGPAGFLDKACRGRFRSVSFFTGAPLRGAVQEGLADFIPVFLSDIPQLFISRTIPLDAALVQVSPPDRHGQCSLGTSVDAARAGRGYGACCDCRNQSADAPYSGRYNAATFPNFRVD
ncbi:MAG UNVERIFIED_CONTAM: hypothetical protein LVR18_11560 [Planctomycetaceae bacterium]|jgi:acyl-CoA hydrolase